MTVLGPCRPRSSRSNRIASRPWIEWRSGGRPGFGRAHRAGRVPDLGDAPIAGSGQAHDLSLATRNVRDLDRLDVEGHGSAGALTLPVTRSAGDTARNDRPPEWSGPRELSSIMNDSRGRCRLAVDVGGTFTDVALESATGGNAVTAKVLTTPRAPEEGVVAAVGEAIRAAGSRRARSTSSSTARPSPPTPSSSAPARRPRSSSPRGSGTRSRWPSRTASSSTTSPSTGRLPSCRGTCAGRSPSA